MLRRRAEAGLRGEPLIVRGGPRSRLARQLGRASIWGKRLDAKTYLEVVAALLARRCGVSTCSSGGDAASTSTAGASRRTRSVSLPRDGRAGRQAPQTPISSSFTRRSLTRWRAVARRLFGIEGREHTAQVDQDRREWREWRFRWGDEDRAKLRTEQGGAAQGRGAERLPAGPVLLADHGARRRHLGAQRGLPAQHAAHAGELRAALGARRTIRPGGAGRDLLLPRRVRTTNITSAAARRW